ncbi:MAG: hypothetical protein ACXACA_06225, partial [Candidatus Ranarchaeia archaeon]
MGLRDIETKLKQDRAWQQKRVNLLLDDLESILTNRTNLKDRLQNFEMKYKNMLSSFPIITAKIQEIKTAAGILDIPKQQIEPTQIPLQTIEKAEPINVPSEDVVVPQCPTLWERLVGRGPFYSQ